MNTHEQELDMLLERLLTGEAPEALAQEFPQHASEITSYARLIREIASVHMEMPKERALRERLFSMRVFPRTEPTPSPFFASVWMRSISTYRYALVIPAFLLVALASGAYVLPYTFPRGSVTSDITPAQDMQNAEGTIVADSSATHSGAPASAMMLKSMAAPAPQAMQLPQDQSLSDIFAPELNGEAQGVAQDGASASQALNDSQVLEAYGSAYDDQSL